MRRLPVYLVIDISGSMSGEPLEAVKNGLQVLVATLRQDPYALETAFLSIITFGETANQAVPLTELVSFQVPSLVANGRTALGQALELLATRIDAEVQRSTPTQKGDWKPLVFLMTDGLPTDDWGRGRDALRKVKTGMLVACGAGPGADANLLKQLTETVVMLDTADSATIRSFFKWVSASVSSGSQKVETGNKEPSGLGDLPPPPPEVNVVV